MSSIPAPLPFHPQPHSKEAARTMREQLYWNDNFIHNGQSVEEVMESLPAAMP